MALPPPADRQRSASHGGGLVEDKEGEGESEPPQREPCYFKNSTTATMLESRVRQLASSALLQEAAQWSMRARSAKAREQRTTLMQRVRRASTVATSDSQGPIEGDSTTSKAASSAGRTSIEQPERWQSSQQAYTGPPNAHMTSGGQIMVAMVRLSIANALFGWWRRHRR
jgi:hypothetical protein